MHPIIAYYRYCPECLEALLCSRIRSRIMSIFSRVNVTIESTIDTEHAEYTYISEYDQYTQHTTFQVDISLSYTLQPYEACSDTDHLKALYILLLLVCF